MKYPVNPCGCRIVGCDGACLDVGPITPTKPEERSHDAEDAARYLTPEQRGAVPVRFTTIPHAEQVIDQLLASHRAADEMLREARAALRCRWIDPEEDENVVELDSSVCGCDPCVIARRIDKEMGA